MKRITVDRVFDAIARHLSITRPEARTAARA
jgi:hypothetical protein